MRGTLAIGIALLWATQPAAAQTGRSPDSARTRTAIAQADARRTGGGGRVVRLRVPVKLAQMLPEASGVSVHCVVSGNGGDGAARSTVRPIVNGQFDQVIEVAVTAFAGQSLIGAKSYVCRLEIYGPGNAMGNPRQGTPPSNVFVRLARPDAPFRVVAAGALDGGTVNDGLVGPGGLAIPPRPRQ